jgi:3-oxocholest-4-en-26-oyl-CoA dehydrogenase beta subunit
MEAEMDFTLSEQQEMLQKSARDFFSKEYPDTILREMVKDEKGYTPALWQKIVDLGWSALSIPEAYGGVGDFLDLIVVLEEMGRASFISPFFSTTVLGASCIMEAGNESQKKEFLPAIAEGKSIFTLALLEKDAKYTPDSIKIKASPLTGGYQLDGVKFFVTDAGSADFLICAARTSDSSNPGEGITLFIINTRSPGIKCNPLQTIAGDKQYEVVFEKVKVTRENILGKLDQGWRPLKRVLEKATASRCAEMLGGAERAFDLATTYAKERTAFGHPIGAYQSIQHRCADMLIDIEGSRNVIFQAAWRVNEGLPAEREVSIAKAWINQALRRVMVSSHQIHGAIGFTEDHILHWYTRRARMQEFSFGDVNFHLSSLSREK